MTSSTWMESILHYAQDVSSAVLEGPREEDRYEWPALSSMYSYNNHLQWHVLRQYSGTNSHSKDIDLLIYYILTFLYVKQEIISGIA